MRKLTSGVYYVDYQNLQTFIDHAYKSGWRWYNTSVEDEFETYIKEKAIIPFSLDSGSSRIGFWSENICHNQAEVLKEIESWTDWDWTDEYIEYYHKRP